MWIDRKVYEDLLTRATKYEEQSRILAQQNTSLSVSLGWAQLRLEQSEREKAALLFNYTGVKIEVPKVAQTHNLPFENRYGGDPLTDMPAFTDMGDDAARKLGISHNTDGTINFGKPAHE